MSTENIEQPVTSAEASAPPDSLQQPGSAYSDLDKIVKCKRAIGHALAAISDDPAKYYLLGIGTETWAQLTTAYAMLWGKKPEDIRREFVPDERRYRYYCEEREQNERLLRYCRDHGITVRE